MTDVQRPGASDAAERRAVLEEIAAEVSVCQRCRLHEGRTRAVPGEGSADTEVVFVGEGPGFNEDRQGRPFVGRAGALLDQLLESVYWSREEVFITNVVKCRPPENRDPEPDEIAACAPFLARQLAVLDPALVVTLGRFSMGRFMPGARIGQVHGTFRPAAPEAGAPEALVFAMYHPAAALRQDALRQTLLADMQGVPQALLESRQRRLSARAAPATAGPSDEPQEVLEPPALAEPGSPPGSAPEAEAEAGAEAGRPAPAAGRRLVEQDALAIEAEAGAENAAPADAGPDTAAATAADSPGVSGVSGVSSAAHAPGPEFPASPANGAEPGDAFVAPISQLPSPPSIPSVAVSLSPPADLATQLEADSRDQLTLF